MSKRIMFVCTGNSARSQMAEGLARALGKDKVQVYSAGLEPKGVHPLAIEAMKEMGIDISHHKSKLIDPAFIQTMDVVVTLCGDARDRCPVLPPGTRQNHWPLVDPAAVQGPREEVLKVFRSVRDDLRQRILDLLEGME